MLTVLPLRAAHAADAARLHILGQPGAFLTRLGPDFLCALYATLPATRDGFGFAAVAGDITTERVDAHVVGFVSATSNVGGLYSDMAIHNAFALAPLLISRVLRDPALLPMGVTTALYPLMVHDAVGPTSAAELLSIMVEPAWRGLGIGALLLAALHVECARRGVDALDVTVDAGNEGARRFYARHGFAQRKSIYLNGRTMCVYSTALHNPDHG